MTRGYIGSLPCLGSLSYDIADGGTWAQSKVKVGSRAIAACGGGAHWPFEPVVGDVPLTHQYNRLVTTAYIPQVPIY